MDLIYSIYIYHYFLDQNSIISDELIDMSLIYFCFLPRNVANLVALVNYSMNKLLTPLV